MSDVAFVLELEPEELDAVQTALEDRQAVLGYSDEEEAEVKLCGRILERIGMLRDQRRTQG